MPLPLRATLREIDGILERHNVPKRFQSDFHWLTSFGKITNQAFHRRLDTYLNFQAARDEIMELLSRPIAHQFSSFQFESLETL